MATGLTLAQMRDSIRRKLQIVPPIDQGVGSPGDLPPGQPDPNNAIMNAYINEGILAINRVVRITKLSDLAIPVAISASYKRGPAYIPIESVLTSALVANEIENVVWDDGTNVVRLEPFDYYRQGKQFQQFQQYPPGRPAQFFTTGHQIGLLPPPNAAGTLRFTTAAGIPPLANDSDTIAYLPVEYQVVVEYWAVVYLSARRATDAEAQTRFQTYSQLAITGTTQIYGWVNGYDDANIAVVRQTLEMNAPVPAPQQSIGPQQQGQGQ